MKNKYLILAFFIMSGSLSIAFLGLIFYYDPLKLFHKPWIYKNTLQKEMRQQAAGMMNNTKYDSIILGTSMLENTSSLEANKKLGGNFINISIAGSDFYERSFLLNYAINKTKLKKVIYSLDNAGLLKLRRGLSHYTVDNFSYLYDENYFNDINAYLNKHYLSCLFSLKDKNICMGRIPKDKDRPKAFYFLKHHEDRFGGLDNWIKEKKQKHVNQTLIRINKVAAELKNKKVLKNNLEKKKLASKKYIDDTLLNIIESNPDTEFILVLPPYSLLYFAILAQYEQDNFELYKHNISYIVNKNLGNLKLFGFNNLNFTKDIANYEDLYHYNFKYNSLMLDYIKENKYILNKENIDNYISDLENNSLKFDIIELSNTIRRKL